MASQSSLERILGNLGHFLSKIGDALESALSESARSLFSSARRLGAWVLRILGLSFKNCLHLLRLLSVFLALVWIGSGFFELTYVDSLVLKPLGWIGTGFIGVVVIAAIVISFRPSRDVSDESAGRHGLGYILIHSMFFLLLCGAIRWHYTFRSPVLGFGERTISALLVKADFISPAEPAQNSAPKSTYSTSQRRRAPTVIAVKCKGSGDDTWAEGETTSPFRGLSMWVESIQATGDSTTLNIAVKTWNDTEAEPLERANGAYFVDDTGIKYDLVSDGGAYDSGGTHICLGDEIYRFKLVFPPLSHTSSLIYLHHPKFARLEVDLEWQNI